MRRHPFGWRLGAIGILLATCSTVRAEGGKAANGVTTLLIKLIDPDGKPVEGAKAGHVLSREQFRRDGTETKESGWTLSAPPQKETGTDGIARLLIGVREIVGETHLPVVAWHRDRDLIGIAMPELSWRDQPGVITLQPACEVKLGLSCPELASRKRPIQRAAIAARRADDDPYKVVAWMQLRKRDGVFAFPAPPGAYSLRIDSDDTEPLDFKLNVPPGRRTLDLGPIKLAATKLALLEDRPAPEFQEIVGWVNSPPLSPTTLKGKVVLLDFWGYWCGPCVMLGIPELVELHDQFHKQGLVIIGVHVSRRNDPVDTPQKFEAKTAKLRGKFWKGRTLPFPVALAIPQQSLPFVSGSDPQIAVAYGVPMYPTAILIDRQGKVAATSVAFPLNDRLRNRLKKVLAEKQP